MEDVSGPAKPPLDGVLVLDLSRVLAGPWCTMVLADLGADVIKIENPRGGDDTRHWGPPYASGESAYFLCANRNKRSVAVDLATAEGQSTVRALARKADVIVENYKLGGLAKFGLDYPSLASANPKLVYCSISGYGRDSPMADRPGYDYVIQAEAGLMAVNGASDGEPMKVAVAVADLFTGMASAQAILAAIIAARRDGTGQHIDMALYDCQLAMLANVGSNCLVAGTEPRRYGNGHPTVVPYQTFEASDMPFVVAVGNDRQFSLLCERLISSPELSADPRFSTNEARVSNRDALIEILGPVFRTRSAADWLTGLAEAGIPSGAVRTVTQALTAPETAARGMVRRVNHPAIGRVDLIASPLKLARTPVVDPRAPPLLGQHTEEVLRHLLE